MKLLAFSVCALLFIAIVPSASVGQGPIVWSSGGGENNNWTTFANWNHPSGGLPTGAFDESAVINNGGTALINSNLNSIASPDGPPGALAVSNGSTLQIIGSGAFVTNDSGPNVDGSAAFTGGGTLSITGATASFTSTSLSFSGGGVYNPVITSNSHGLIAVPGAVEFSGGVLRPTFGYSPSAPRSWTLIDAAGINGSYSLDASSSGLPLGQRLTTSIVAGGANGQQLRLNLSNVLALTVNADTGAASISSPTGTSIVMTGYGVASAAGQLKPAGWSSLTSQLGGGWNVAGTPSATRLDELGGPIPPGNATQASLSVNSTPRGIGNPFTNQLALGVLPNVSFQYVTQAGEVVDGAVQVTGLNAVNNLLLTVDPATGQGSLKNSSQSTIKLRGYSILSDSGALKPANGSWNSIHDQGVTGVDEANASANHLSELIPLPADTLTLAPGQTYSMGGLFNTSGSHDLRLEFALAGGNLAGDFNKNGVVDAADYTVWRNGLGGTYTQADYSTWKSNFGATGSANGAVVMAGVVKYQSLSAGFAAAVPEPSSVCLAIILCGIAMAARREVR